MNDVTGALPRFAIGQPMRRLEDARFITGTGRYVDDWHEPGLLHAAFLRAPLAHAELRRVDAAAARKAPGVVAVYTGADWKAAGLAGVPLRPSIKQPDGSDPIAPPRYPLAQDRVRHVGDCVAVVIAQTPDQAIDALELVEVEYDALPAVTDPAEAAEPGAPQVWAEAPGNRSFDWEVGDGAKTKEALAAAARVVELRLTNNRLVVNSMETRGVVARWDEPKQRFELLGSIQNPFTFRALLCDLFGWKPEQLHAFASDVGGGFGCKNQVQPEHAMLLFAADKLRRPVKWVNDRTASFQSDAHARDLATVVRLGLDAEHRFTALQVETIANLGAYISTNGALVPTLPTAAVLGGAYAIPALHMHVRGTFTNTVPVDAYRGAGRPEATYLLERIVDIAAREVGLTPVDLRRRNLLRADQLPYKTPLGRTIDCGGFLTVLDKALALIDAKGFPARAAEAKSRGARRGLGVISYLEATLGPPSDAARIAFEPDGTATISVGTQSNGQGHETSFAQLAGAELGIDPHRFRFRQGDTDATPEGGGHGGSRSLQFGGTATMLAARKIVEKGKTIAAHLLEAAVADLEWTPGAYRIAGTDRSIGFDDVVRASFDRQRLPDGVEPGLDERARYEREAFNYPNGVHACEVEIDLASGAVRVERYAVVDDFGRIVNPLIVTGQVLGGVVQGIGQALLEEAVHDRESGQLLTASFNDYCLPRADNLPPIDVELWEGAPTATNPLGAKGCGEAGATGSPPAVANAVLDALAEFGIRHLDMPYTPQKVWAALAAAKRG